LLRSDRKKENEKSSPMKIENPFQLSTALKFGVLLGVILVLSEVMKEWLGDEGIYILSVVSGLMDVDAITLSLSKMATGELPEKVAATAIVLATITNTIIKGLMFAFITKIRLSVKLILVLAISSAGGLLTVLFLG
jgi:uncharacterized membrane protein (DUF4010 family)